MASMSEVMSELDIENETQEGITVAIRMRPLNKTEGDKQRIWKVLPKYNSVTQTTSTGKPLSERITGRTFFTFDKVFGEDADTTNVYDSVAKGIVSSVVNGLNGTIFAYGQTSSGKTYTMQGAGSIQEGAGSGGGVVHMAARDIFSHIQSQSNRMFLVRASFLEIYNEEVRDLLSNSGQTLQIREDPRRGVFVHSHEEMVTDFESLLRILFEGEKSRAIASTGMNERSSRSHTIFRITIESREKEREDADDEYSSSSGDGAVRVSTLNLVDLAGSESVRHTGATGERQKEGGMINQSLLTLSRVMVALGQPNQTHVNFRDSKLTRILQPSLSGNARMAVICCATPSEIYLEETRSTLQFASRAKLVKTNAQVNEVLDDRSIIRKLQRELAEARGQKAGPGKEHIRDLETKAASAMEANAKLNRLKASILNASYLFGGKQVVQGADTEIETHRQPRPGHQSRKRRQSDGGATIGSSTPSKLPDKSNDSPKTAPRKKKEKKTHLPLSPRSELFILREALSARNDLSRSLKATLVKNSQLLCDREEEVKTLLSENDGLADEKEQAYTQLAQVEGALASVQANLDTTIAEYDTLLAEKEVTILEVFQKVEMENSNVTVLKEANASLTCQLYELQQKFDALQAERIRSAFELAQNTEEKEKLQAEREKDRRALHEMNQKVGVLTTAANDAERVRKESEGLIGELQEQLSSACGEKSEALERLASTEAELAEVQSIVDNASESHETFKAEMRHRLDSTTAEKENAIARFFELEKALQNAEESKAKAEEAELDAANSLVRERNAFQASVSELQRQLQTVSAEKADALHRVSSLEEELGNTEEELATATQAVEKMTTSSLEKKEEADKIVHELQDEIEVLTSYKAKADGRTELLEDEIKKLEDELEHALEKVASLTEERSDMEGTIDDLREQFEVCNNQKQSAIEHTSVLEDRVSRLEAQLSASKDEIAQARADAEVSAEKTQHTILVLEEKLEHAEWEKRGLIDQVDAQGLNLDKAIEDLDITKTGLAEISNQAEADREESAKVIREFEENLGVTLSQKNQLLERCSGLEEAVKNLQNQLFTLVSEKKDSESKILELQEDLQEATIAKDDALAQISALQNEISDNERDLETARLSAADLCASISDLEQKCKDLTHELSSEHELRVSIQEQLETLQLDHEDMSQAMEQLEHQLAATENTLQQSKEEYDELTSQLESTNVELEVVKSDLDASIKNQDVSDRTMQSQINIMKEETKALQAKVTELSTNLSRKEEEISTFEALIEQLEAEKDNLSAESQDSLQNCRQEVVEANAMLNSVREDNERLREDISTIQSNYVNLRTKATAKEIEKSDFVNQVGSLSTELEAVRSECITLESTVEALHKREASLMQEFASFKEASLNAEADLRASIKDKENCSAIEEQLISELRKENESLSRKLEDAQEVHDTILNRLNGAEKKISLLMCESDDSQERFSSLLAEKDELERFLAAAEDEVSTLLEEKTSLEFNLNELRVSLDLAEHNLLDTKDVIKQLEKDLSILMDDKGAIVLALETCKAQHQRDTKSCAEELLSLREELVELEGLNKSYQNSIEELSSQNEGMRNRLAGYEVEKVEIQSRIMALEAEQMALLAEKDSMYIIQRETVQELEDQLLQRDEEIDRLAAGNGDAVEELQCSKDEIDTLKKKCNELESLDRDYDAAALKSLNEYQTKIATLKEEKHSLEAKISQLQVVAAEKDALRVRCDEMKRALEESETNLESALASKEKALTTLRAREMERDEAVVALEDSYQKNQELSQTLANAVPLEREEDLQKEISELKKSNLELKQLLVSSNGSEGRLRDKVANFEMELSAKNRELEDAQYRLSQLEEELRQSELAFEEKLALGAATNLDGQSTELVQEIESLRQLVEKQTLEHKTVVDALKNQMGEEQRILIQEGEKMMSDLRLKAEHLQKCLIESEQEAYTSREQLEDFRDQKDATERRLLDLQAKFERLESSMKREESRTISLESELNKARAESYSLRENTLELKEKLRRKTKELENFQRDSEMASSEVATIKRQMANIEKTKAEFQAECDRLKAKLRVSTERESQEEDFLVQIKTLQHTIQTREEAIQSLEETIEKLRNDNNRLHQDATRSEVLKTKMKEKDQRIKKLEAVKLTKEFAEEHKKLKRDNKSLRSQVADLQRELLTAGSDSALRTELSELRFDKEALESKLRKFATHCQRLEDDKAGMVLSLRSCNIDTSEFAGDVNEAVISLCDKLASLQEAESLRSRRSTRGSESELAALQAKLDRLLLSEESLKDQVTRYQAEIDGLHKSVSDMKESHSESAGENGEMNRKLRYLEQENLQLMFDVKTTRKQLQAAREEIEVLRMNAMDSSTLDFGTVDLGSDSSQMSRQLKAANRPGKSSVNQSIGLSTNVPLADSTNRKGPKESAQNLSKQSTSKTSTGALDLERARAPGLGEAAVKGDETGECSQS